MNGTPDQFTPDMDVDLAVIGFGKGGKTLVGAMAAAGHRTVLIEHSADMYGGTCINIGCVPSKTLAYAAEHPDMRLTGQQWFEQAAQRKSTLTAAMRAKNFELFNSPAQSTVITGHARFTGPHSLEVTAGQDRLTVRANYIVINTGAEPALPALDGLNIPDARQGRGRVLTSTSLLALTQRPKSLVILGGGYVGVEFASSLAQFGTQVTLVQRGPHLLPAYDAAISQEVRDLLTDAGVDVVTSATVQGVNDTGSSVTVSYSAHDGSQGQVTADYALVALGRSPVTAGLGLQDVGIVTGKRGEIVVDEFLRTNLAGVFAVGDVNGGPQFTYISLDDYRIVLDQLTRADAGVGLAAVPASGAARAGAGAQAFAGAVDAGSDAGAGAKADVGAGAGTGAQAGPGHRGACRSTRDRVAVPQVVFTHPPLAHVGLTLAQAKEAGYELLWASRRVADMPTVPRAKIVGDAAGIMTAVVDAHSIQVLGVTILAHDAHEIINTVALAMRAHVTANQLRDGIYTHPSMTEAFNDLFAHLSPA